MSSSSRTGSAALRSSRLLRCPWRARATTPERAGRCSKRSKSASRCKCGGRSPRGRDRALDGSALGPLGPNSPTHIPGLGAMALVWALFMLIVFVVEPIAHARLAAEAAHDPGASCGAWARTCRLARGGDCNASRRGRRRAWRTARVTGEP